MRNENKLKRKKNKKKASKELLGKTFKTKLMGCSPNISAAIPFALPGSRFITQMLLIQYYNRTREK